MEAIIIGLVKPVLEVLISVIRDMFRLILDSIISPLIKFLVENTQIIIDNILVPLATMIIPFVKPMMSIGTMFVFKLITFIVGNMIGEILKLAILPINFLEKNEFLVSITGGMQVFAIALLILVAAYAGLKSTLAYKWGEYIEEPWKIMIRVGTAGFMVYNSIDICTYFFKAYYVLQAFIFGSFGQNSGISFDPSLFGETLSENMFNTLDPVSQLFDVIVFGTIAWRLLILAVKFIERQVLLMLYVIFSPITMACSVAKQTREVFALWSKTFAGNFLIQGIQIVGVCLIFAIANSEEYKTSVLIGSNMMQNLMLLGCVSILLSTEAISFSIMGYFVGFDLGATGFTNARVHAQTMLKIIYPATESFGSMAKSIGSTIKNKSQKI